MSPMPPLSNLLHFQLGFYRIPPGLIFVGQP